MQNHAERPDVGALVGGLTFGLFGSHVACSAQDHPSLRGVHADGGRLLGIPAARRSQRVYLRQTEIENLHSAAGRDFDIGRLQVAMDDALFVRGFERSSDLPADLQRVVERQRSLGRFALHQLHHDVVRA